MTRTVQEQIKYCRASAKIGYFTMDELADTMEKMLTVVEVGQRSLNWLASYPGGGAENTYYQMRKALDTLVLEGQT